MDINCVWEHSGDDTLLYAATLPGAYTRGGSLEEAVAKMPEEVRAYLRWAGEDAPDEVDVKVTEEKVSALQIRDADSDVLFETERPSLTEEEYRALKALALRSAGDFHTLYTAVPDPDRSALALRETFYGPIPRTAREMYEHTKNVNSYYFGEIGVDVSNDGTILDCREAGFTLLEKQTDFLKNQVFLGSYDEYWSLRKVLRRFIWHDRIHAKALYRMAQKTFGPGAVPNVFYFPGQMLGRCKEEF